MPWQAADKSQHFNTGLIGGALTASILEEMHIKNPYLWTVIIGLFCGFAYEVAQKRGFLVGRSTPDVMDAMNTAMGFAAGGLVIKIKF